MFGDLWGPGCRQRTQNWLCKVAWSARCFSLYVNCNFLYGLKYLVDLATMYRDSASLRLLAPACDCASPVRLRLVPATFLLPAPQPTPHSHPLLCQLPVAVPVALAYQLTARGPCCPPLPLPSAWRPRGGAWLGLVARGRVAGSSELKALAARRVLRLSSCRHRPRSRP